MRKTLAVIVASLILASPAPLLAPDHDHGLGDLSRDTAEFLATAQALLDQAQQGDLEAMAELANLFREDRSKTSNWYYMAAIRGHEKSMVALIFDSLDNWGPRYYTAWAWIQAAYKLGVLDHPQVGTYGSGGEGIQDEQWFRERMKPEDLHRAYWYSDKLYRRVTEAAE
jgi:TPR repeat protein